MADHLRTQAGPWCGGLTDTSVVIRASVLRSVRTARVILAEDEQLSRNPTAHHVESMWSDPERSYRHQIASFTPRDLRPDTNYFFRLELDGDTTKALPGRFRTAPRSVRRLAFASRSAAAPGHQFSAAHARSVQGHRRDAGPAVLLPSRGLPLPRTSATESLVPRLEAYDDTLRRDGVGDMFRQLPIAYCWDDHDFLGNNSDGGDPSKSSARRFARDAYDSLCPPLPARVGDARASISRFRLDGCCFC